MKRVLIVDDAVTVRSYHRQVLEAAGFVADEAANGMEGLEKALSGRYDLFLIDVNMPRMDGYSLLTALRQAASLAGIPAIVITTESGPAQQARAIAAGANFMLTKPVTPEELTLYARMLGGADV
ncbi:response regulator [Chitiniphilus purpureus]|uniref:Response regulator n=1 Tax=Chitiniphilus purpureus TaxID=2981137 RepID=A0ABY6DIT3_9NEIS|nr:response regulator [Chitiniphilus sp. CD1]UXY14148.1 response regulator [Chitiniphilus sp. CD1]